MTLGRAYLEGEEHEVADVKILRHHIALLRAGTDPDKAIKAIGLGRLGGPTPLSIVAYGNEIGVSPQAEAPVEG